MFIVIKHCPADNSDAIAVFQNHTVAGYSLGITWRDRGDMAYWASGRDCSFTGYYAEPNTGWFSIND